LTKIILGLIILLSNIKPPTNHQEEAMTTAQLFLQKFLHNGFFAMECLLALGLLALSLRCIPWYFSQDPMNCSLGLGSKGVLWP